MSCDNLQGNGRLTRLTLVGFARLRDPELAEWVEREVCFPNSMVDRITPVTTDDDRAEVLERFGIADGARSCASRSRSGCSRTRSRPGARPTRRPASRSSTTSSPTS